jgi:acetylornithine deacetylase/succinyl-diaminopimelate desuccinylase-like protein
MTINKRSLETCRWMLWRQCLLLLLAWTLTANAASAAESAEAIEKRLVDIARLLASDELEGRGIGSQGLEKAGDYIASRFSEIGLTTQILDEGPFQPFSVTTNAKMGPAKENRLKLIPPDDGEPLELKLGKDFNPLCAGGSSDFDLPLVFAGYGITSKEADYDDFADVDVKGKCVVILRHQPFRGNPHGPFGGDPSRHAFFETKISNAVGHGAAAIVFCTGQHEIDSRRDELQKRWQVAVDDLATANTQFKSKKDPSEKDVESHRQEINSLVTQIQNLNKRLAESQDPVLGVYRAGAGSPSRKTPILFCRRGVLNSAVKAALGKDLATLEAEIDKGKKPLSANLAGWRVAGKTLIQRERADIRNVVAVWDGEGPRADETIVIGAHYDHLGYGGPGSAKPGSREIHNGADDNASGVAVMLEVARRLVALEKRLPRRVVFIAFTGEERGLLGSAHYVANPVVPLEKTIAMLNMDMVGRLKDNKLIVHGTGSAEAFDMLVKRLNAQHGFQLIQKASGFGPSDHTSFYEKKIPVLHFFTGAHQDYHRPSDDYDKLNAEGMRRIASLVADITVAITEAEAKPEYRKTKRPKLPGGRWPYFGSRPDYAHEGPGVRMAGIAEDSPAERAGVKPDDVIVRFGDAKVTTVMDFANALSGHKAGDKVVVVVMRDGQEVRLTVTLDPPRR